MCLVRALGLLRKAFIALVLLCALVPTVAAAEDQPPTRAEELEREIGEAGKAEVAALQELVATQARLATASDALAVAAADLESAAVASEISQRASDKAAEKYFSLFYDVGDSEARVRSSSAAARSVAVDIYVSGSASAHLSVVEQYPGDELSDSGARSVYLDRISEKRQSTLDSAQTALSDLETAKVVAETSRAAADSALAEADEKRVAAQNLETDLEDSRAELAIAEADETYALDQIRARKSEFENELAALAVESGTIAQMLIARQSTQPRGNPSFINPVDGVIVSAFGSRMHPILGYLRMHTGIDMDGDTGDEIRASAGGIVAWAGSRGGYGNCVIIDHGNQFATLYAHQSAMAVQIGDTVTRGQTIGYVGSTGMSTGPHLHFEVRDLGTPKDPEQYL